MMISICTPSRGLVFFKTMKGIIEGMQELNKIGIATQFVGCDDLPIPDCFNYCIEQSLQNSAVDRIIFIEEDNYLDPQAFVALATAEHDIATVQYNDRNGHPHGIIHKNEVGDILWCGFGATMIKRSVFETLGAPYMRTDTSYKVIKKHTQDGPVVTDHQPLEAKIDPYKGYGRHDVDFYARARASGYQITQIPNHKSHHFELVKLGEKYENNGLHIIRNV